MMIGCPLASSRLTVIFRLGDHVSTGPNGVAAQSISRIRLPISPPPERNARLGFACIRHTSKRLRRRAESTVSYKTINSMDGVGCELLRRDGHRLFQAGHGEAELVELGDHVLALGVCRLDQRRPHRRPG